MKLEDDLAERISGCRRNARANYFAEYFFLCIAVAASATATISVAADSSFPKELNAALAALPGIILLLTSTFKFEARSGWWWDKYYGLDQLYRELKYEDASESDISKKMTEFLSAHGKSWPSFGKPP